MTALIRWHNVPCFAHPSSMGFKLFHFYEYGKSLIIVAYPTDALQFKPLFGAIIAVSGGFENDRNSDVKLRH